MPTENPLVSVILPAYNAKKYLQESISSILSQSLTDLELIVIDDGSFDGSIQIIRAIAKVDSRVRVISRENRGLIKSLNEGIGCSRGKWVVRMDADDVSMPDRLEKQLQWLQQEQADICGGWIEAFGVGFPRIRKFYRSYDANCLQLLFNSCVAHPAVMIRRDILSDNPYKEEDEYAEDYALWCRLVSAGARITNYPGVILRYRLHRGQITVNYKSAQDSKRALIAKRYLMERYSDCFSEKIHSDIMGRGESFLSERNITVISALSELRIRSGDPEGVISDNAFIYLVRHGEVGIFKLLPYMSKFKFTKMQRVLIGLLSILKADQNSFFYKFLYRVAS